MILATGTALTAEDGLLPTAFRSEKLLLQSKSSRQQNCFINRSSSDIHNYFSKWNYPYHRNDYSSIRPYSIAYSGFNAGELYQEPVRPEHKEPYLHTLANTCAHLYAPAATMFLHNQSRNLLSCLIIIGNHPETISHTGNLVDRHWKI